MTDPRFYPWLWQIENEIRPLIPMVYYHVWDNYPIPKFNKAFYKSNDFIATISKVTSDIVQNVAPEVAEQYIPHAVSPKYFHKFQDRSEIDLLEKVRQDNNLTGKFVVFWNNRNARRKMSGSVLFWWKAFLDEVGHDNATLIMHTDVKDVHGQDLEAIITSLGLINGEVMFSTNKYPPEKLANLYSLADCTINVADAEGFGLSTFESLSRGTPIVVNMTGGLQEQVTDGEEWFGVGIEPNSKAIIGSQDVPYIYEDRISKEDFIAALHKIYNMTKEERKELGRKGRDHVLKNYNFEEFQSKWVQIMDEVYETNGSWENRKNWSSWKLEEVA